MRTRTAFRLSSAFVAVVLAFAVWLKLNDVIPSPWILIASPLIIAGGVCLVVDVMVVALAAWKTAVIIVARRDAEARKGHTIRRGRQ